MKALALLALFMVAVSADHYSVLIAGSSGFDNYRHQADVCHAYQLLLSKGIPADNIIVMSYDDVASSSENPYPNQLYNKPSSGKGVDVNKGCVIDYKGDDVTPDNYIAVITGGSTSGGNGRVLKSGSEDHVFLAFFDHGGTGLIGFPNSYLEADKLNSAFNTMHSNNMYKQLTYYMEACESGSMFQELNTPNLYALSAASPSQSSYADYCSPQDKVNGVSIGSCLGDLFSTNWMENSDAQDITSETLESQWKTVKKETDMSKVMQWGDLSFTSETVSVFQGTTNQSKFLRKATSQKIVNPAARVDVRDVRMHYLTNKFNNNPTEQNYNELQEEMSLIKYFEEKFNQIQSTFALTGEREITTDYDCYRSVIARFESKCGKVNDNGMRHFKHLYELCQNEIDLESTFAQIDAICA